MRNLTIYLTSLLCLFLTNVFAQETFEDKAKAIADKIETITKEEKEVLKLEIESVNQQLENGSITNAQADEKKLQLAESRAKSIEYRVAGAKKELEDLIQEKVDGKIYEKEKTKTYGITFNHKKDDENESEKRTTTQLVFAFGLNNLVTDGALAHSDYRYWGSHFYEWGLTWNTRLAKNSNLLHLKYGASLMYNNLRPTDNRAFVDTGKQTELGTAETHLKDSRFRNVYIAVPVHLEFDFSKTEMKDDKKIFRSHNGFRFGLGGFVGGNIKSKQILEYKRDGHDVKDREKGDYNVNDFIYGASAYVGYKALSLYAKYNISPLFKNNTVDQNNISYGLRFDFN